MQVTDLKQKNSGESFAVKDAKAGSVFVPVPYDENWKCKVNEEDVVGKSDFDRRNDDDSRERGHQ